MTQFIIKTQKQITVTYFCKKKKIRLLESLSNAVKWSRDYIPFDIIAVNFTINNPTISKVSHCDIDMKI